MKELIADPPIISMGEIREKLIKILDLLRSSEGTNREKSLAITKIQEAIFWLEEQYRL